MGLEFHATAKISFYDLLGKELPFYRNDFEQYHNVELPDNYSKLLKTAEYLAEKTKCPFLRIDLYSVNNRVYFSEFTFTPCGGFVPFEPEEWDRKLGNMIVLPIEKQKNEIVMNECGKKFEP